MYAFENVCFFVVVNLFLFTKEMNERNSFWRKKTKKNILEINDRFKRSRVRSPKSETNQDDWILLSPTILPSIPLCTSALNRRKKKLLINCTYIHMIIRTNLDSFTRRAWLCFHVSLFFILFFIFIILLLLFIPFSLAPTLNYVYSIDTLCLFKVGVCVCVFFRFVFYVKSNILYIG